MESSMNTQAVKNRSPINWQAAAIAMLLLAITGLVAWAMNERSQASQLRQQAESTSAPSHPPADIQASLDEHGIIPLAANQASNASQTATDLAFILEEEKLAHDVYQAMYKLWGARVFGNITNSEATHQSMVLAVMQSRNLPDPRQTEAGRFTNVDLQKLYDQLIAQGSQGAAEAYAVGVLIEETDIADITKILSRLDAKDTDVKDVLENLMNGSENHLRAFNRQVAR